jgi:voltage-gated potassium channel
MKTTPRKIIAELLEPNRGNSLLGRWIDIGLITLIILNVIAIALESVSSLLAEYRREFYWFEVISVIIFSVEYLLRLWCAVELEDLDPNKPIISRLRYFFRPLVIIDLLAILPFYLAFFISVDLRFLRVLRLLRILKLSRYSAAMNTMLEVLREERSALGAALFILFILLVLASSGIYLLEHKVQPEVFGSIPAAMWWSMVTLTTVGYGDVIPSTALGKVFGGLVAIIGIGVVAMPTGILASGFANAFRRRRLSFEQEIDAALEDGEITLQESETLEHLRERLGISEEEAEEVYQQAKQKLEQHRQSCPKCGHKLGT